MNRLFNLFILLAIAWLLIAGCAGPTPYQSAGSDGYGYSSENMKDNRYVVHVKLNPRTPPSRARVYWAGRVKELCGCEEAVTQKALGECFREISYHERPGSKSEDETVREYDAYGNPFYKTERFVPEYDTTAEGEVECLKKSK